MPVHPRFICRHAILGRKSLTGLKMRRSTAIFVGVTTLVLFAASVSSADARRFGYGHRGPGPVLGLIGGVVVGAATIATLPFALLADAARPAPPPPPAYYGPGYGSYSPGYGPDPYGAAPPPPPPRSYRSYGPPPPGYYGYGY
jgi:hypothetical protein